MFKMIQKLFFGVLSKGRESGNVMILAVLSSVIFIGVTGLAVDYGNAILLEAKLKSATDIATLAGIQDVPYSTQVEYQIQNYMSENYPFADDLQMEIDSDDESCWVITSHDVPTYFMRYFGQNSLTIKARSKATLVPIDAMSGIPGIMPFVLLNPNKNNDDGDDLEQGNHGEPYVLKYGPHNTMIEDWYFGRQIVENGVIHGGNGTTDEIITDVGWRGALGLDPNSDDPADGNSSGAAYETNFGDSWLGNVEIGDFLNSNPGNMTMPTVRGRDVRLDGFTSTNWNNFDPNLDPENGRIIIVPIVSLGQTDGLGIWHEAGPDEIFNGEYTHKNCRIDGFAAFFLLTECEQVALPGGEEIDRKWVVGRFLYGVNIGGDINNPSGIIDPGGESSPDLGMYQGRLVPF